MRNERSRGNEDCPTDDSTAGQPVGHENTHPHQTVETRINDGTLCSSAQFPAETPNSRTTTQYDKILVAGEDAILFEPSSGGRDG